jgi:hypothetical protein
VYDFLIPYRHYTVAAFESATLAYLTRVCSYAEALWSSSEEETQMVCSTLFRAVAALTEQVWLAQQQLQTAILNSDATVPAVETDCPNAIKSRTPRKFERLNALAKLIALAQVLLEAPVLDYLHRLFATKTEYKFSLFSTHRNLRLSAPHYMQTPLF